MGMLLAWLEILLAMTSMLLCVLTVYELVACKQMAPPICSVCCKVRILSFFAQGNQCTHFLQG
jgi:hypothetical protein